MLFVPRPHCQPRGGTRVSRTGSQWRLVQQPLKLVKEIVGSFNGWLCSKGPGDLYIPSCPVRTLPQMAVCGPFLPSSCIH